MARESLVNLSLRHEMMMMMIIIITIIIIIIIIIIWYLIPYNSLQIIDVLKIRNHFLQK